MKPLTILFLSFLIQYSAIAQDNWKVTVNSKTVLTASEENPEGNVLQLSSSQLKKKNDFIVQYNEAEKRKGWQRTITLYTEQDSVLAQQNSARFRLSNQKLLALLKKAKTSKIYTWSLPADPKMKASIRIRRVHLCTLVLK